MNSPANPLPGMHSNLVPVLCKKNLVVALYDEMSPHLVAHQDNDPSNQAMRKKRPQQLLSFRLGALPRLPTAPGGFLSDPLPWVSLYTISRKQSVK